VGATALDAKLVNKNFRSPEMNQGDPSMSKSMETNTAAIYLRKSTEDDGKSVDNDDTTDENGNEVEALGIAFAENLLGGTWVQTSYNNNIRKQYAGTGFTYNASADVFISPQPFPSWSLDSDHDWQPPTPMPDDGEQYLWDEDTTTWVEIEIPDE